MSKRSQTPSDKTRYRVPWYNRILRVIIRQIFRAIFHTISRVVITGLENVPIGQAYLIAINHVSIFEPPLVAGFWPEFPEAAGAAEIWSKPGQSILARAYGGIPVHRGEYDRKLLQTLLLVLESGYPLLIAPEGGRTRKPGMRRALPGIAYLIDKANLPVIPVGIVGSTDDFFAKGIRGKRPQIEMHIGQPIFLPKITSHGKVRRKERQRNADLIMYRIADLMPPEYRGIYDGERPLEDVQNKLPPKPISERVRPQITHLPPITPWRQVIRWLLRLLARLLVWLFIDTQISGVENIPSQGSALVVSNHLGDADLVLGIAFTPRFLDIIAKAELYDHPVAGWLLRAYGVVWIHRGRPDRRALRAALTGLAEGRIIAIAPEGRQSISGALEEGTSGAAYLAIKAGAAVIPVTMTGTENQRIFPNMKRLRRTPVAITIGPPLKLETSSNWRADIRQGTKMIMQSLASQLPPEYQGVFLSDTDDHQPSQNGEDSQ